MNMRHMDEEDLKKVITTDRIIFEEMTNENRTNKVKINGRNIDILRSYLEESDGKSIVVEEDGQIVGYLFTHIWGQNAWIGPLGVLPNFQNKGIAKLMIEKSISEIKSINISNITLETMPEKTKNIGLYLKLGFNSHCLRFRMEKNNIESKEYKSKLEFIKIKDSKYISEIDNMSLNLIDGFKVSKLISSTNKYNIGESYYILKEGKYIGFIIMNYKDRRDEKEQGYIKLLMIDCNEKEKVFLDIVKWCENKGIKKLVIPIYSDENEICNILMDYGYNISSSAIRLNYQKNYHNLNRKNILIINEYAG